MSPTDVRVALVGAHSPVLFHFFENVLTNTYQVVSASSYEEITNHVKNIKIDLIIVDEKLGKEEEIFSCLSTLKTLTDVPILVITGSLKKGYHRRLIAAGASDFLTQPLDPLEIETLIERVKKNKSISLTLNTLAKSLPNTESTLKKIICGFMINDAAAALINDCQNKNFCMSVLLLELDEIAIPEQKWIELDKHLPAGQYQIASCGKRKRMILLPKMDIETAKQLGSKLKALSGCRIGLAFLSAHHQGSGQELFTSLINQARENPL